jgi:hypothetical protein
MEAGEVGTLRDLAIAVNLAKRHVRRQLRLAYLAPLALKRLARGREGPAVTAVDLSASAALPWAEQARGVFEGDAGCQCIMAQDRQKATGGKEGARVRRGRAQLSRSFIVTS